MKHLLPATRQVHLDFHTSQFIPGIAEHFDSKAFAKTFADANVESVTVFARCHHGYVYYNSEANPELIHPNLSNKNLLLEQIDALHAAGLRAPVYTTIRWDLYTASRHPEWLVRNKKGEHQGGPFTEPGFYQSLCVNTGYWGFLKTHVTELLTLLKGKCDGFFFDITGIQLCWCTACLSLMHKQGIDVNCDTAVRVFAKESIDLFKERLTALVRQHSVDCTIFYNAGHVGPCTRVSADSYSHFELESLPAGGWGYLHYPVSARFARTLGKDCMGMTGKFHTSWGDFHSLKNQAALEYECFRMLSYGQAVSIGDQLEPFGQLNPATYKLIGGVYKRIKECEPWARPSAPLAEAALITSENILFEHAIPDSIMGAVQMLEELAIQFDIIDTKGEFAQYKLIILPDDLVADTALQQRLDDYVAAGGAVIACYKGGANADGQYPSCYSAEYEGVNENYPDFILSEGPLSANLEPDTEYVMYKPGVKISTIAAKTTLQAHAPYFPRVGEKFCSHKYTPSAKGDAYPVALKNGRVILFAHPIFEQYRDNAPRWCKTLIDNAVSLLLPARLVRHNGPSTMTVSLLDQPELNRAVAHLLSYVPVRKSATIDIIEERTVLHDVRLEVCLPGKEITSARIVPEGVPLELQNGVVTIPKLDGYAVVEFTHK